MPRLAILTLLAGLAMLASPCFGDHPKPEAPASGPAIPAAPTLHPTGLTPAQEREVLAFLQEHFPALYDLAERLRREDPSRYYRLLRSRLHWIEKLKQMPEEVRTASILQAQTATLPWRISRQWRRQKDAEVRKKLRAELSGVVTELFGAEQIVQEHRIAKLARSVERRRKELSARARNRGKHVAEIVDRYLQAAGRKVPKGQVSPKPTADSSPTKPAATGPTARVWPKRRRGRQLTEQLKEQTLGFLKEHLPEHHKRVVELRKKDSVSYERTLLRWFWWVRRWERMPPEAQKAYLRKTRASLTAKILARRIRRSAAEKKTLTDELRKAAGEIFDADLALRKHQLDQLEERIHALRDELLGRSKGRDRLIRERVERYLAPPARRAQSHQPGTPEPATRPSK